MNVLVMNLEKLLEHLSVLFAYCLYLLLATKAGEGQPPGFMGVQTELA
jgi:hypothetical protein